MKIVGSNTTTEITVTSVTRKKWRKKKMMTQTINLIFTIDDMEINQELYVTPQTYQILVKQAKEEITRKYGVPESEIRVLK
jgi:hypothetical protein